MRQRKLYLGFVAALALSACNSPPDTGGTVVVKTDTIHHAVSIYDTTHVPVSINDTSRRHVVKYDTAHVAITLYDTTTIKRTKYVTDTVRSKVTFVDTAHTRFNKVDTSRVAVTVYDTAHVHLTDTTRARFTVYDTLRVPINRYDTTHISVLDTVHNVYLQVHDSLQLVLKVDTVHSVFTKVDTVHRSVVIVDTTKVTGRIDTLYIPPTWAAPCASGAANCVGTPLPPGQYAGVLCDSLVVIHQRVDGSYFVNHLQPGVLPVGPINVYPKQYNSDIQRPYPWVAVVVEGGNKDRMRVAYLPGDTEVLKNQCYNGASTVFDTAP